MIATRSSAAVRPVAASRRNLVCRAGNIIETAKARGFSSFVAAVESAGLTATLSDPAASFTVFVPTDAAFKVCCSTDPLFPLSTKLILQQAYDGIDPYLKKPIPLVDTLLYHVVKGKTQGRHLGNSPNIPCLAPAQYGGASGPLIQVNVRAKKGSLLLGSPAQGTQGLAGLPLGGFVIEQDIVADNGLIHVVDGVFKPQEPLPANNGSAHAGAAAAW